MFQYKYARPSVAVSVIIRKGDAILFGKRQPTAEAYPSTWCIPGGFLDAKIENTDMPFDDDTKVRPGETTEEAGVREVLEETGLVIGTNDLRIVGVYSHPDIDPRCHVVHVVYYVNLVGDQVASAGDDLAELEWFKLKRYDPWTTVLPILAFNHSDIVDDYLNKVTYL